MNTTKFKLFLTALLLTLIALGTSLQLSAQKAKVSVSSLLDELISTEEGALFPSTPYKTYQVSSYDRASVAPGKPNWFANNDGFGIIREEDLDGKKVRVLFDEVGPGAITRIWVTAINKRGTIRFYIDGAQEPTLTMDAYDFAKFGIEDYGRGLLLKHTSYRNGDDARGGSTFFFPITYAKSCKVTYEAPTDIPLRQKYYHFNVRKYPANTNVQSFTQRDIKANEEKIKQVNAVLNNPTLPEGLNTLNKAQALTKGKDLKIDLPSGENAVYELKINLKSSDKASYAQLMRSVMLKATFDGNQTVLVPIGDFSGSGFGGKEVKSWFLAADGNGAITSRWIMPYQKNASITLLNVSDIAADVSVEVKHKARKWTDRSLYFYSVWRYEQGVRLSSDKTKDPNLKPLDWNFADITGRGVFKGDVMSLYNHTRAWYGEGDEKIYIDGETFPSHFGTGLEDYYNSSWAPVVVFQTPFGGATRADLPSSHGYNTFFRTRNLDGIVFNKSMKFDMETLSWSMGKADFATVIYFYADAKAKTNGTAGQQQAALPVLPDAVEYVVANAIEFEKIKPSGATPNIVYQKQAMNRNETGLWSDGSHMVFKEVKLNDEVAFKFDGYGNNKHKLKLYLTKSSDFGILSFTVNGKKADVEFDTFSNVLTNAEVDLGEFSPVNGGYELVVKVVGTNAKSRGGKYLFGLDAIQILNPLGNNKPVAPAVVPVVKAPAKAVESAKPAASVVATAENGKVQSGASNIEFENLTPSDVSDNLAFKKQDMARFKTGVWSETAQLVVTKGQVGDHISFKFDGYGKTKHKIRLLLTKAGDFGTLSFTINGKKVGDDFDAYNPTVTNAAIDLGEFAPVNGSYELTVKIVGANEQSKGAKYYLGLDAIQIYTGNAAPVAAAVTTAVKSTETVSTAAGAIEFETTEPVSLGGNITTLKQNMQRYTAGKWSGNAQLVLRNIQLNDEAVFKFAGYEKGKYNLNMLLTKATDFGILNFWVNGKKIAGEFDSYDGKVTNAEFSLGDHAPVNGAFELKVKVVGSNPSARGGKYLIGLDAIQIIKK